MRLVVDTNVFVSAALKANSLPFIVVHWIDHNGGLLKSAATEQELLAVSQRPYLARVTTSRIIGRVENNVDHWAPPFTAAEIYFDPAVVGGATEQEVIDALIRAGRR